MIEAIETEMTTDRAEFLEHMEAVGAQMNDVDGFMETWTTCYAGRDNIIAGTWDRAHKIGTLDLL